MSLAVLSLLALVLAVVVSCTSSVNIGFLAIVLAWVVGVYLGGMSVGQVLAGFPTSLFLTLVGVTLLFAQAQVNGTLDRLAHPAIRWCRGNAALVPIMFFLLAAALASIGPGNIAATALMAPIAMAAAARHGIPVFLMAVMVTNGANAGSVSPIAPTGIIVNGVAAKIGLTDVEWTIYLNNLLAHVVVGFSGYLLLGGWRLFARPAPTGAPAMDGTTLDACSEESREAPFELRHWLTVSAIATLVLSSMFFDVNVGMVAFTCAVLLTFARAVDEKEAIHHMPWNAIMMVSGVTTLVALLEKTGGLDLFTAILARFATPETATGVIAFVTGTVSIYSSTSGVVIPAFVPMVPDLIQRMGGGDAMALVSSITVGGHLVDLSPVSTLGALCIAAAPPGTDHRLLFNQLLAWGISMSIVGALVCWLVF